MSSTGLEVASGECQRGIQIRGTQTDKTRRIKPLAFTALTLMTSENSMPMCTSAGSEAFVSARRYAHTLAYEGCLGAEIACPSPKSSLRDWRRL